MLVTLSTLALQETQGTEQAAEDTVKFLNYCATHPDAIKQYKKSDVYDASQMHPTYLN
jgi:hypothetical protein